ncbi:unnamed protein product [Triticum turgidum subsp. durum]|uniref:Uncharacterized protein n=1 Tax=Triticum turgidum subsp. durum TaxID=4567 RepID=A0A9R0V898_TRITD|nr:unnamed protein product [Triticum turgidum subsp. durum]
MACHCEGKGWKFWGDSNLKSKFWGQSIQLDPSGILTLEFDDGETGNKKYSCKLMFKEQSFLERNPRQALLKMLMAPRLHP